MDDLQVQLLHLHVGESQFLLQSPSLEFDSTLENLSRNEVSDVATVSLLNFTSEFKCLDCPKFPDLRCRCLSRRARCVELTNAKCGFNIQFRGYLAVSKCVVLLG
jgi:hypothetical protein